MTRVKIFKPDFLICKIIQWSQTVGQVQASQVNGWVRGGREEFQKLVLSQAGGGGGEGLFTLQSEKWVMKYIYDKIIFYLIIFLRNLLFSVLVDRSLNNISRLWAFPPSFKSGWSCLPGNYDLGHHFILTSEENSSVWWCYKEFGMWTCSHAIFKYS